MSDLRIGHGFDVHAFAPGRKLFLCGVEINHTCGLAGHSDADVAIHALMDAITDMALALPPHVAVPYPNLPRSAYHLNRER